MTAIANPGTELVTTMNAEEASSYDRALRIGGYEQSIRLYILHRQGGFRHLFGKDGVHFNTIEDYAADALDMPKSTVYGHLSRVEVTLDALGETPEGLLKAISSKSKAQSKVLLPTTVTRTLQQLPAADLRKEVYTTMQALKGSQTMTDAEYQQEWKKAVKQKMVAAGYAPKEGKEARVHFPPPGMETTDTATAEETPKKTSVSAKTTVTPSTPPEAPSVAPSASTEQSSETTAATHTPNLPMFDDNGVVASIEDLPRIEFTGRYELVDDGVLLSLGAHALFLTDEQIEEIWKAINQG